MRIRKVINRTFGRSGLAGAVNAAVSANVNERGRSTTRVKSRQRIVQRDGRTVVHEERTSDSEEG